MLINFTNIKFYASLLVLISLTITCNNSNINREDSPIVKSLSLQKVSSINVPEPSGLSYSYDKKHFWSVCDENSLVYKMQLNGIIVDSFKVSGEDLEGVTVTGPNSLAVVLERTREVVILDTLGKEIKRKKFDLPGNLNEGLEGICFDDLNKKYYLLNEKNPGLLIKTDEKFNIEFKREINFADDFSDIYFAEEDTSLWILSDESKKILQTDLEGKLIKQFYVDVVQPEGLIVDYKKQIVFIVSDKKEELYQFKLKN